MKVFIWFGVASLADYSDGQVVAWGKDLTEALESVKYQSEGVYSELKDRKPDEEHSTTGAELIRGSA